MVKKLVGIAAIAILFTGCGKETPPAAPGIGTGTVSVTGAGNDIAKERGLTPEEVEAALKTYPRPGKHDDEFIAFLSGGHAGTVIAVGLPSCRILKEIPVYSAQSWSGWGFDKDSEDILSEGNFYKDVPLHWGDVHHPKISVTNGEHDGDFLAVADKSAGRLAIVDLKTFKTIQVIKTPNTVSDHGNFWTPNSEYFVTSTFFPAPIPYGTYAPIEQYAEKFRGMITFHSFDRKAARVRLENSFQIELPPYIQDLMAAGKKPSFGYMFTNSLNTELAYGGNMEGRPAMEIGASKNEMDFVHVIHWKKAEELVKAGRAKSIGGVNVLPLEVAAAEGVICFIPISKSPHGVDVTPDGEYLICAGKLDPHATVFSWKKIKQLIDEKKFESKDRYGIPILSHDACLEAYVELGLGPLHTVFDGKGYAYTSLFLDSAIAKWSLGGPRSKAGEEPWKLQEKIGVHYNIGHLTAPATDTIAPLGKYVLSLNKWSVDRFPAVGPLHPQNMQLIDISGDKMKILYDLPIGIGEPHAADILLASKLKAWTVYPEVGTNTRTLKRDSFAVSTGRERVLREDDKTVRVFMTVVRSQFRPDTIRVKEGDHVILHLTNVERARDATHGFALHAYNVNASLDPGATVTVEFDAKHPGVYPFYCSEFCSALHMEMIGWLLVEPKEN